MCRRLLTGAGSASRAGCTVAGRIPGGFVAVEGYPISKRPFYTHPQPGDGRWSNRFDLLFRGMELVTGGQRLHQYSDYVTAILARDLHRLTP